MNIDHILNGDEPSLNEYTLLVDLTEKASTDLLWMMLGYHPEMHWLLSKLIDTNLKAKMPKNATNEAVSNIINKLSTLHDISE